MIVPAIIAFAGYDAGLDASIGIVMCTIRQAGNQPRQLRRDNLTDSRYEPKEIERGPQFQDRNRLRRKQTDVRASCAAEELNGWPRFSEVDCPAIRALLIASHFALQTFLRRRKCANEARLAI